MSILHRATGVLLFISIPVLIYLLQQVLSGETGFNEVHALLTSPVAWFSVFIVLWALMHHLLAGIRYLLLDIHVGVRSPAYRYSAWSVMIAAPVAGVLLTWVILP